MTIYGEHLSMPMLRTLNCILFGLNTILTIPIVLLVSPTTLIATVGTQYPRLTNVCVVNGLIYIVLYPHSNPGLRFKLLLIKGISPNDQVLDHLMGSSDRLRQLAAVVSIILDGEIYLTSLIL